MVSTMVRAVTMTLLALALGCRPTSAVDEGGGTTSGPGTTDATTGTAASTMSPTTALPTTASVDDTTDPQDTGSMFIACPEGGPPPECNYLIAQDCPRGEKCVPWSSDGTWPWDDLKCAPVVPEPDAVGEPCTVEGNPTSGIDTCEVGSLCFAVDPQTLEGTCTALCSGAELGTCGVVVVSDLYCEDPQMFCVLGGDGALAVCLPRCHPLAPSCPEGEGCYWNRSHEAFQCWADGSGDMGAPGDSCNFFNYCDPGSLCLGAVEVPDCAGEGCCSSVCELTDPMPPCLPGQQCEPWYEPGMAPPGDESLGICVLPG